MVNRSSIQEVGTYQRRCRGKVTCSTSGLLSTGSRKWKMNVWRQIYQNSVCSEPHHSGTFTWCSFIAWDSDAKRLHGRAGTKIATTKNLEEKQLEQKQLHSNQPEQKNNITALIPNINIKNMMERYMCYETLHNQHSFTAWIQHVRILTPTRNFNSWMKQSLHNKIGTEIRILSSC